MDRPLVSVSIITYNHEPYIRQCLESVVAQKTNFAFEVVIGEDCSKDNTRAIIREFEAKYPDIIKPIYHEKNVGMMANGFEYCYKACRGKYIACLEGDDYWSDENKLQMQVDALENDPTATACFTQVSTYIENTGQFEEHWSVEYNKTKDRYTLADILKKFNIVTCTLLFKNIFAGNLPYDALAFPTGDVPLTAFLLLQGDALYIDKVTAVYRLHNTGIYSPNSLENKNLVFVRLFEQFLKYPQFARHKNLLKELLADRAYQALCFEIKKDEPSKSKVEEYYHKAMQLFNLNNIYYPLKTLLRKNLYHFTGKGFGRQIQ